MNTNQETKTAKFEKEPARAICFRFAIQQSDIDVDPDLLLLTVKNHWLLAHDTNYENNMVFIDAEILELYTSKDNHGKTTIEKFISIEGMINFFNRDEEVFIANVKRICSIMKDNLKMKSFAVEFYYQESHIFLL